ncbi:MAG: class I SAM-dependent methyltransferase [Steroidobacteraceae bacterium]
MSEIMHDPESRGAAEAVVRQDWPEGGLESVDECPVCGSTRRRALYVGLRDNIFFCAPGEWALHDCLDCGSAYLDPRPSAATLHLAYRRYYTHDEPESRPAANLRGLRYLRRLLINGYKNWRFCAKLEPASPLGVPLVFLLPFIRTATEHAFRHLPRTAQHGRLLDIGFGSGAFLDAARAIGWEVSGVDPDSQSVSNALKRGLNVYQGDLAVLAGESNAFDVITLSHVIEHVHKPIPVLEACHRLLKPGGMLCLETPNIRSLGRERFQNNWRGLETPRHLVIFNRRSLHTALKQVGFTGVRDVSRPNPCFFIYASSQRMKHGLDPYANLPVPAWLKAEIIATGLLESCLRSRREYVSVTARKPKEPGA